MSGLVDAGSYDAKVVDYAISTTKEDKPVAMIKFQFTDDTGQDQTLNWYGYFTEKTIEKTLETLAVVGWSTNDPSDLTQGKGSGVLDESITVSIVVEHETYEGKTRAKVRWVNQLSSSGFQEALDKQSAAKLFQGMNIKGAALAARKKFGPKEHTKIKNHAPTPPDLNLEDEIPF